MPKANNAKTKSAPKADTETSANGLLAQAERGMNSPTRTALPAAAKRKRIILYSLGITAALFAVLAPSIFYQRATVQLKVHNQTLSLEIANDDASRKEGLSDRNSMATNKGMLFVYDNPASQCFWMKDMHFSLDMIFLNHKKQIVQIYNNVAPKTYPKNFCATNTQYVIELNTGESAKLGLHTGQTLNL